MMHKAREQTNKLLDLMSEGVVSAEQIVYAALGYMSERDVADMVKLNGLYIDEEELA